jgi:S-ribosylhomocysteine lyase
MFFVRLFKTNSFNLDHTKVVAPFIRLAGTMEGLNGDKIHKYDIHFVAI